MGGTIIMQQKLAAEAFGTFWLVFGGCGAAIFAAAFPGLGVGFAGVALAFGLTVLTMAYAVGHVSGGHFNPAVTLGLVIADRHPRGELLPYWAAQLVGAILAAGVLYVIANGAEGFSARESGFAANGYGALSPGGYGLGAALVSEVVLTAFFLIVILGVTDARAPVGFAPLAIWLALTLIHLICIPITNTSVNPARSTSQALFAGGPYIAQLWLFWVAPLAGGALGALCYGFIGRAPATA